PPAASTMLNPVARVVALMPLGAMAFVSGSAAAAEHGMPQLDISTFTPQLVWLVIWFVVLYVLMAKLALPRVAAAMEARRQRREGDLARATQLRADAEAASAAYQKALAEARAQAQSTIKETSDRLAADAAERQRALAAILAGQIAEAERIAAQAARDLQQSLERRQRLAEERIAQAESKAIDEIRAAAVDVAIDAARRVIVSELDERRGAAMLDTAIASLPQRLRQ